MTKLLRWRKEEWLPGVKDGVVEGSMIIKG